MLRNARHLERVLKVRKTTHCEVGCTTFNLLAESGGKRTKRLSSAIAGGVGSGEW